MNGSDGLSALRKRSRSAVWVLVACLMSASGGEAWAQGKGPAKPPVAPAASAPVDPAVQEADKRFDAGVELVQKDKWAAAYEEFRAAYAASAQPKYLAALIKAEIATGREAEAAEHLTLLLRQKDQLSGPTVAQAEAKLTELKAKLGVATITVNVEGAEVLVAGKVVGTSPVRDEIFLAPGRHTFEARKAGLVLAPGAGAMDVTAGSRPAVGLRLEVGKGTDPGSKVGGPNKTLIYVGIGVAGALAVVGVGTAIGAGVKSSASQDELDNFNGRDGCNANQGCTDRYNDLQRQWATLSNVSLYSFIGAAVIGGGTAAYALLGGSKRDTKISVMATPQGGGFAMSTTW